MAQRDSGAKLVRPPKTGSKPGGLEKFWHVATDLMLGLMVMGAVFGVLLSDTKLPIPGSVFVIVVAVANLVLAEVARRMGNRGAIDYLDATREVRVLGAPAFFFVLLSSVLQQTFHVMWFQHLAQTLLEGFWGGGGALITLALIIGITDSRADRAGKKVADSKEAHPRGDTAGSGA